MPRFAVIALALSMIACAPPCEDVPLSPLSSTPRFVVEVDDVSAAAAPQDGGLALPGIDAGLPEAPSSQSAYAALPLYAADGALVHDHWIDTRTRWNGARDSFDSHDVLPWSLPPGQLPLLLQDVPSVTGFAIPSGQIAYDLRGRFDGASIGDLLALDETSAMLTASDGRLLVVDLASGSIGAQIDLRTLVSSDVRAGRLARLTDGSARVVVGLAGDTDADGEVAVVDVRAATLTLVAIPGLRECAEVSALADGSIAVLCAGTDGSTPRLDAGLALLEPGSGGTLATSAVLLASTISSAHPPTNALVGMSEGWVAVLSRGDGTLPDALLAVHLASGTAQTLSLEPWSPRWGPALGEGAFASEIGTHGELWWPSVTDGVLRFRVEGEGASARFVTQPALAPPGCLHMPARRVRGLPP